MMKIFSLVSFRFENVLSLELFLHALFKGTDFSTLTFYILKCLGNGKNRNNQFPFSTRSPRKVTSVKNQIPPSQQHKYI